MSAFYLSCMSIFCFIMVSFFIFCGKISSKIAKPNFCALVEKCNFAPNSKKFFRATYIDNEMTLIYNIPNRIIKSGQICLKKHVL